MNLYKHPPGGEIKLYKMSESENKMEDEYEPGSEFENKNETEPSAPPNSPEDEGKPKDKTKTKDKRETKICSLCHESIDPDLKMKWLCKHFVHKDCALKYLIKKQSCSSCLNAKKKRKESLEKEKEDRKREKECASRNWDRHPYDSLKISSELFKFFKRDYDAKMDDYNKIYSFLQYFTSEPDKPNERMSRNTVRNKIIDYCKKHKFMGARNYRIFVNESPRLRKLLGYPMKEDKNHLTSYSLKYYIEKHLIKE
uniref:Ring finger domain protein n=1 Tax=Iridovirus LCIVAC01 TaxID=2506607 RepID=A0A481YQ68_9VIRU|nr:MAG: ring finger domain protein [Iridovirus LCIVAC01]